MYKKSYICKKNDSKINKNYHHSTRMSTLSQVAPMTVEIVNEFVQLIDNDKEYDLKELKALLSDVYKTKTTKPKAVKVAKSPKAIDASSEDDEDKPKKRGRPAKVNNKPKREPSAYNKFVKECIKELKVDKSDTPAKDLMKMAAAEWKNLTKQEQESYK